MAPELSFPTPVPIDRMLVEKVPCTRQGYRALPPRSPHPTESGLVLWSEKPVRSDDGNLTAVRVYGNARAAQDSYNAAIRYTDAGDSSDVFVRSYYEDRRTYVRGANGTTLKRVIDLKLNAGGTGYLSGGSGEIALTFSGGAGSGASGKAEVKSGVIVAVFLTAAGDNYTSAPTVVIISIGGSGVSITALLQTSSAVLVDVEAGPADAEMAGMYYRIIRTYMVLPGPWVYTRRNVGGGVFLERKSRKVLSSTYPTAGSLVMATEVEGINAAIGTEIVEQYTDNAGVAQSAPIYLKVEFDYRLSVFRYTKKQKVASGTAPAAISSVLQTGDIFLGQGVETLNLTGAGSGYTYLPSVTIQPTSRGLPARAHATMKLSAVTLFSTAGTGYAINDVLTLTEGTFGTAATITITKVGLNTVAVNAAGSGYVTGETITLANGTFTQAAQVRPATLSLSTVLVGSTAPLTAGQPPPGVGSGYATGDTITLAGGTLTTAPVVTVATALLVGLSGNAVGSGYLVGQTITLSGGTSSTKAVITISTLKLSGGTFSGGINYAPNDQITFGSGTFTTAATVLVTSVRLTAPGAVNAPGSGYYVGETVTLAGGTASTKGVIRITQGTLVGGSVGAGGVDYAVGDTISIDGTVAPNQALIRVDTVSAGAVTAFTVLAGGLYDVTSTTHYQFSSSSDGTGFQLTPSWGIYAFSISNPGEYTVPPATFTQFSTSGSGTGAEIASAGLWGPLAATITSGGSYTVTSGTQAQGSSTGTGTGALLTGATYGVGTFTITNRGDYSASTGSFTQFATSGSGSGATFNTALWGAKTVTVSTPGIIAATPVVVAPATYSFTQASSSALGSGATFYTPVFALLTVAVSRSGSYSSTLPTTFTQASTSGSGAGATFNTPVWGAGAASVTAAGALYTQLPYIGLSAAQIKSAGVGYAIGDSVTLGPPDNDPPIIAISAVSSGRVTGFTVSHAGQMFAATVDSVFTQTTTTGNGNGLELWQPTLFVTSAVSGGGGTGAMVVVTWKVDTLVLDFAGTHYFGNPTVTIQGNATATATVTTGTGITTGNVYVVEAWVDPIEDSDKAWKWTVGIPLPPTQTTQVSAAFTKPARFAINYALINNPPWPGIDYSFESHRGGNFKAQQTRSFQIGQWAQADLPDTYAIITPGVISRLMPIRDKTRHPAFTAATGTYAENIPASSEVGYDSTLGYVVVSEQELVLGDIWQRIITRIPP